MKRPVRTHRSHQSFFSSFRAWGRNDHFYRANGPAIEYDDGAKEWWDKGERTYIELGWSSHRRGEP